MNAENTDNWRKRNQIAYSARINSAIRHSILNFKTYERRVLGEFTTILWARNRAETVV
jgi:hypothetical protein